MTCPAKVLSGINLEPETSYYTDQKSPVRLLPVLPGGLRRAGLGMGKSGVPSLV